MRNFMLYLTVAILLFSVGCTSSTKDQADKESTASQETTIENPSEEEAQPIAEYRKITPEEAKDMMDEASLIIDVRTQEEYDQGYIEGALLVPLDTLESGDFSKLPEKDQVLLVYCRSGNRSRTASKLLVEAGYTQVYDFGGIKSWPYDIVKK